MNEIRQIGFIGYGVVAKATEYMLDGKFKIKKFDKFVEYDSFEDTAESDLIFIAVPTPFDYDKNQVDISAVAESLDRLTAVDFKGIVVIKSTVPPRATEGFSEKYNLELCFNPEFLREKTAYEESKSQTVVIIGTPTKRVFDLLKSMYQKVLRKEAEYFHVSSTEAEIIKYAQNVTFASRVTIANIIYDACDELGVEYNKIKELGFEKFNYMVGYGSSVEVPGPDGSRGFGGKCLPKDTAGFNSIFNSEVVSEIISYNNKIRT